MYPRLLSLLALLLLPASAVHAQQTPKQGHIQALEHVRVQHPTPSASKTATAPFDTLRNFDPNQEASLFTAAESIEDGFIYGTNTFLDRAKATRLSLPQDRSRARLTEIVLWFGFRNPEVTTETYDVELYAMNEVTRRPGPRLWNSTYTASLSHRFECPDGR